MSSRSRVGRWALTPQMLVRVQPRQLVAVTLIAVAMTLVAVTVQAQQARWHRYAQSRIDDYTSIDVLKDVYSKKCYAIYVAGKTQYFDAPLMPASVALLGEVPCDAPKR